MTPLQQPSPTIEITVAHDGSTTVETHGFVGSTCKQATAFLERALGRVSAERLTAAYHQTDVESVQQHERSTN